MSTCVHACPDSLLISEFGTTLLGLGNMSISVAEKIRIMRDSERLTRRAMSELTGIPYSSLSNYELDKGEMGFRAVQKLLKNEPFNKYTDWFLFDRTNPKAGQISPALAHFGQNEIIPDPSDKSVG